VGIARGTQQHCWCTQQFLKTQKCPCTFSFYKICFFFHSSFLLSLSCVSSIPVCFLHFGACAVRFLSVLVVLVLCFGMILSTKVCSCFSVVDCLFLVVEWCKSFRFDAKKFLPAKTLQLRKKKTCSVESRRRRLSLLLPWSLEEDVFRETPRKK